MANTNYQTETLTQAHILTPLNGKRLQILRQI